MRTSRNRFVEDHQPYGVLPVVMAKLGHKEICYGGYSGSPKVTPGGYAILQTALEQMNCNYYENCADTELLMNPGTTAMVILFHG